jgi:nucleolar protein 4
MKIVKFYNEANGIDNGETTGGGIGNENIESTTPVIPSITATNTTTTGVAHVSNTGVFVLKRRTLVIDVAVNKETAATLALTAGDKKMKGQDRRNLHLLKEGQVHNYECSTAFDKLHDTDKLKDKLKRQNAWNEKNTKLRSPLFFIDPLHLSVRNLAKHVDEKQLKQLCADAVRTGLERWD